MEPGKEKNIISVIIGWVIIGIGVLVYLTQKNLAIAIVSGMVVGTLINNIIVLVLPNRVSRGFLIRVINTSYIMVFVYLALWLFPSARVFLNQFGVIGKYGFAVLLGFSVVLATIRRQQFNHQ